jgi:transposase
MDTYTQSVSGVAVGPAKGPKRQLRTVAEKRQIVEETMVEGASVARIARAHGVNANQVFYWRMLY